MFVFVDGRPSVATGTRKRAGGEMYWVLDLFFVRTV